MKAIILAAGMGTRLKKYTHNKPKVMLPLFKQTLAHWHIENLTKAGIDEIAFVGGFCIETLVELGYPVFENRNFGSTNMIESLMCAESWLDDDVLIVYGDIWLAENAILQILESVEKNVLAVDSCWRDYWKFRYDRFDFDLEQLEVNDKGVVTALGRDIDSPEQMAARYVGAIKLEKSNLHALLNYYHGKVAGGSAWHASGKVGRQGYMTDILDELIQNQNIRLYAEDIGKNWLEFDTNQDYERVLQAHKTGQLPTILNCKIDG